MTRHSTSDQSFLLVHNPKSNRFIDVQNFLTVSFASFQSVSCVPLRVIGGRSFALNRVPPPFQQKQ